MKILYLIIAVSEKSDKKEFNITAMSGHSSFKNINLKSKWLKKEVNLLILIQMIT